MKTFVKIFLVVLLLMLVAAAVFSAPLKDSTVHVTVTPTHYKDLLILKADKTYMGATVEVHDSNGTLVTAAALNKKKMIIDFYDIPYGLYTICVIKDRSKKEFHYTKRQDLGILY